MVAGVAAAGGVGAAVARAGGGRPVRAAGGTGSSLGSPEEREVDTGRRWRAWWRPGEQDRRGRGPGVRGGALWSGSGASERLRRGGGVGSVSAVGGCAVPGGSGSAAICGTGLRRGASRASQEVSAGLGGRGVVPPGTGGGGVPRPPWIRRVGVRWRGRLVIRVE